MTLTRPTHVRERLRELDLHPSRRLGQNFLVDGNILAIILDAADLRPQDRVLEIGPGLGVLTGALLERVATVTAVEKDRRLFEALRGAFRATPSLQLHCADIMEMPLDEVSTRVTKVVANLPYGVASRLLVELARSSAPPPLVVVTVQEEVARRLAAEPGTRAYGLLSVWVQFAYDVSTVKRVSPACFWPRPEVWSAVVKLAARPPEPISDVERDAFYGITRYAFEHRRKQMQTILRRWPGRNGEPRALLDRAGIEPRARPETLALDAWLRLTRVLE
jgi:16S rRNA (adenine1518-N6/adenine1519-N6)-dimethyltransferase